MSDPEIRIQEALQAARSGDTRASRRILSAVVREDPSNARAWYLLSQVVEKPEQASDCLRRVLALEPGNFQAQSRLDALLNIQVPPASTNQPSEPGKAPCPNCGKMIAWGAEYCKYCEVGLVTGEEVPPEKTLGESQEPGPASKKPLARFITDHPMLTLAALIVIVGCICAVSIQPRILTPNYWLATPRPPRPTPTTGPTSDGAAGVCKRFMNERLKAPSTAKFQNILDADVTNQGDTYTIKSYVDAQNSFGATIRTRYVCVVRYTGSDTWRLESLVTDP